VVLDILKEQQDALLAERISDSSIRCTGPQNSKMEQGWTHQTNEISRAKRDAMSLRESYERIKEMIENPESFEVVEQVETYRNLWKPVQVNVVLLAESHVYTSQEDFREWSYGQNPTYHGRLVRFVYYLGYGENLVKISSNPGTPQFWKILCSCLHAPEKNVFAPILNRSRATRIVELRTRYCSCNN
jgi:hypothetical protein